MGIQASSWDDARPPAYVAEQLANFRIWGTGGEFAIYHYGSLNTFNYTPYAPGMVAASTPSNVDSQTPRLVVTPPPSSTTASTLNLTGQATDNLAIRAVRWVNDRGGSGEAVLTWTFTGGLPTFYTWTWRMDWTANGIPLQLGTNTITITVEDIKGLTTAATVTVTRTSGLHPGGGRSAALGEHDLRALGKETTPARTKVALKVLTGALQGRQRATVLHAAGTLQLLGETARPSLPALKDVLAAAHRAECDHPAWLYIRFSLKAAVRELEP